MVMAYHLYTSFLHMHLFCRFFHNTRLFPQEVACHLVAPDYETDLRYWEFGNVYATPHFEGFMALPVFLLDIDDLEESSDEEEG